MANKHIYCLKLSRCGLCKSEMKWNVREGERERDDWIRVREWQGCPTGPRWDERETGLWIAPIHVLCAVYAAVLQGPGRSANTFHELLKWNAQCGCSLFAVRPVGFATFALSSEHVTDWTQNKTSGRLWSTSHQSESKNLKISTSKWATLVTIFNK